MKREEYIETAKEQFEKLHSKVESMYKRASVIESSLDETIKKALRDKDELYGKIIESKEEILLVCREYGIPAIVARGGKGGSTVACAILNALLYEAAGLADPSSRS